MGAVIGFLAHRTSTVALMLYSVACVRRRRL